jgi:hypothetical protein
MEHQDPRHPSLPYLQDLTASAHTTRGMERHERPVDAGRKAQGRRVRALSAAYAFAHGGKEGEHSQERRKQYPDAAVRRQRVAHTCGGTHGPSTFLLYIEEQPQGLCDWQSHYPG